MIPTHMDAIHISTARRIMEENEFSVSFLTAAGEIRHIDRAVSLDTTTSQVHGILNAFSMTDRRTYAGSAMCLFMKSMTSKFTSDTS